MTERNLLGWLVHCDMVTNQSGEVGEPPSIPRGNAVGTFVGGLVKNRE